MKTSKIKKIKVGVKQTYDITVSNNHNFFCNNHLIHNCGYTGEVKIVLFNSSQEPFQVERGMRIAQAVYAHCMNGKWVELEEIDEIEKEPVTPVHVHLPDKNQVWKVWGRPKGHTNEYKKRYPDALMTVKNEISFIYETEKVCMITGKFTAKESTQILN